MRTALDRTIENLPARDRFRIEVLITAGILAMVMADPESSNAFHSDAQRECSSSASARGATR